MTNINDLKTYGLLFSLFLISLDAYTILNIPIQWIGLSAVLFLFVFNFKKIDSKINALLVVIILIIFTPVLFEILDNYELLLERDFQLRLLNYVSFFVIIYVAQTFLPSISQEKFLNLLEKLLLIISIFTVYIFISQIFDLFEPIRNRSNTNLLGNAAQSIFWPYEPHRAMGTFREPVLFASYVFPLSLILFLCKKNISILSTLLIALALGLTRSDLLRIYAITGIILFTIFIFYKKSKNNKIVFFLSLILLFSFISIQECEINQESKECLDLNIERSTNFVSFEDLGSITNLDSDRKNTINFLISSDINFFGEGFNSIISEYQQYLTKEINQEMYITNRVLPKYLNNRYQSQNFGTGNYSANFYKPNTQSMLINVIISSGIILILVLFAIPMHILFVKKDYDILLKVLYLLLFFFIIPIEELNAFTGLIFGYGFKILDRGYSFDQSI